MPAAGWRQLIPSRPLYRGEGRYFIEAYSEFMPPPRLGWKPYGQESPDPELFSPDDPWGWSVSEHEEAEELQPGLLHVARQVLGRLGQLHAGDPAHGISRNQLHDNPCWPAELADHGKALTHERCVILLPLALSRTQDDKGRVRWTVAGGSEQGPAKAFWKSFFTAPGREAPAEEAMRFFVDLLRTVYHEAVDAPQDLRRAGFRILPQGEPLLDLWDERPVPEWTSSLLQGERSPVAGVKYLLTFRPFARLPAPVRKAYLAGQLNLLPCPGSLLFWGIPHYLHLHQELPLALQVPLLHLLGRHRGLGGLKVPQAGFLHEPSPEQPEPPAHYGPFRGTFKRTHRWDRILRDQDELALLDREDKLLHVLFSSIPDDLGLYDKPMARNVQLWTTGEFRLLLDGPPAGPVQLKHALKALLAGGTFGYRFVWPAMRVGRHEVYWHRPLAAYRSPQTGEAVLLPGTPPGYVTAYPTRGDGRSELRVTRAALERPIELWPRLHQRPVLRAAPSRAEAGDGVPSAATARHVRKLHDASHLLGGRSVPRRLARQLLALPRDTTLDSWLGALPRDGWGADVRALIEPVEAPLPRRRGARVPDSRTFERTSRRSFEVAYWNAIQTLAEGRYLNKNNADCVLDATTQGELPYHQRHLEPLGDFLLAHYRKAITRAGLAGRALAGAVPFQWRTDFDFSWMGGWRKNQDGPAERDLLVLIPGRDRGRAVIMADHYDTAYMADRYEKGSGGRGARLAACGADDNHSATAALMLAAPLFLDLSKAGRLGCDVWLVHLTGEEFPADCLGARALTQCLVEGTLELHLPGGRRRDLSGVRVQGVYVSDMIAHNNDRDRDVFQIAPGTGRASFALACQAHLANEVWNASVPVWNEHGDRAGRPRGRRSPYGAALPEIAPHLVLSGEVRPPADPRSTLYNTDGQIFSDAGVPVVLFMENYDINRSGYHDTRDTMANIDLDYGAALAAIVIEAVARAAAAEP